MHKHRLCLGRHGSYDKEYTAGLPARSKGNKTDRKPVGWNSRWRSNSSYHNKRKGTNALRTLI